MTTPRIEEIAQELRAKYKLKDNTIYCQDDIEFVHEVKKALTKAHQAVIDEAVEVVEEYFKGLVLIPDPQSTKDSLIKALQDNK